MPEGKMLTFSKTEYPELDGHEDGMEVTLKIKGTITNDKSSVNIDVSSFDFDAGNSADKEMSKMTGKSKSKSSSDEGEDDF